MVASPENLVWIDLEMTGLDTVNDQIIEIATVVTDKHLGLIAEGPVMAIHQPEAVLDGMDDWNKRTHGDSGLLERVRQSTITPAEAERATLDFLRGMVPPGMSPMCGNSICQDRRFMARLMPELERFFHYRNLDVSTLKELAKRWTPELALKYDKRAPHMALDDIHESIRELRYYRDHLFKLPTD
jgi:oligoribonuclease